MEIFNDVIEIIKCLGEFDDINIDDKLQDDLSLDSLTMVALLVEIEETFNIELEESDMNPFDLNTVEDVVNLVVKYCGDRYE